MKHMVELELQIEGLEQRLDQLQQDFAARLETEVEESAEEAILAGYELGYLQAIVKMAEKKLFLEEASNLFDEIAMSSDKITSESVEELLNEIDDELDFDGEDEDDFEQEWEDEEEWDESDFYWDEEEKADDEELELENEEIEQTVSAPTAKEVAAAIRSWVGGEIPSELVNEEDEEEEVGV